MIFTRRHLVASAASALFLFIAAPLQAQDQQGEPSLLPVHEERLVIETSEGSFDYSVELALNGRDRASGLMFREQMDDDHGMLFRFEEPRQITMWMRNTLIPLDMIFIRGDGTVAGHHADAVPLSEAVIASPEAVLFVLELNAGKAEEMGLAEGDRVSHPIVAEAAGAQ